MNRMLTKRIIALLMIGMLLAGCGASAGNSERSTDAASDRSETVSEASDASVLEETGMTEEEIVALLEEGRGYYYGLDGAEWNLDKALERFTEITEQEATDSVKDARAAAFYYIGQVHDYRYQFDEAKTAFEQAKALGNQLAKVMLGQMYMRASGVQTDYDTAKRYYQEALDAGCVEANCGFGDLYLNGFDGTADAQKAMDFFEKGAASAEPEWRAYAYGSMAAIYSGNYAGIERDEDLSIAYYKKADEASVQMRVSGFNAKSRIAGLYKTQGENTAAEEWYALALADLEAAYAQGSPQAMYSLGSMYHFGSGVTQDYATAAEWYEKAAAAGDRMSMVNLGYLYKSGQGAAQDYAAALKWYEKAADAGGIIAGAAMNNIGEMYENGEGVTQDYATAMEWYEKGAATGHTYSMISMGNMYYNGAGADVDYDAAYEWFKKALNAGNENAQGYIDQMISAGYTPQGE